MSSDKDTLLGQGLQKTSRLRAALGHVGLCLTLSVYTVIGGIVFRELEFPSELGRLTEADTLVRQSRHHFLEEVLQLQNTSTLSLRVILQHELDKYERAVQQAAQRGVLVPFTEGTAPIELVKWNHLQAIFFASTVLTTIGYGNIAPVTWWGRMFCILFALIGIPLCLTVIADLGYLVASSIPDLASRMERLSATIKSLISALAALTLLLFFLSVGAFLFTYLEDDWSFFDSFYFCFITMTTIGFGDLVPQKPQYMLLCTLYILIGLGLTSTIIEIVRMEYAKSWERLQALAETLRRLGEAGGGSGQAVDLSSLQGDLRRVLSMMNRGGGKGAGKNWEATVDQLVSTIGRPKTQPKIVQIIIYESSV